MIQKLALIFLLPLLVFSCSGSDDLLPVNSNIPPQITCKINSTYVATLTFDDIKLEGFNSTFSGKLHFDYDDQNRIIKTRGGLKATYTLGSLAPKWAFYDDVSDTITYNGNVIAVKYSNNANPRPYDKEFTVENGRIESRKVTSYTGFSTVPVVYTYEYTDTGVMEKVGGVLYRTFTIENGNLTKVERLSHHYLTGEVVAKEEMLFGDYDSSENWLKGKYYVNGAFFKAFSVNNYTTFARNQYTVENGQFVLQSDYNSSMDFGYDTNGVAELFFVSCN